MPHILIVGGSDAGISAALQARTIAPAADISVVVRDAFPNYSICGLPFYLSGEVRDWRELAHRSAAEIEQQGIALHLDTEATAIDAHDRRLSVRRPDGAAARLRYDRLVLCTGAAPRRPPFAAEQMPGVHVLRWMADAFAIEQRLRDTRARSAVIVGGGYLGLELADALVRRGLEVTLLESGPSVLGTVHASLGERVGDELAGHGVAVSTGVAVERIEPYGARLRVVAAPDRRVDADIVLVLVGAAPVVGLATAAGIATGAFGAIATDQRMATNAPNVWAAGDCVETHHRLLGPGAFLPLGSTAHKQGRVAGENAAGGEREYKGTLGTQVVKVFELAIARTGLRAEQARAAGFDAETVAFETFDRKAYYPGAHRLALRLTGDRRTGRILGGQILGHHQGEVAKRIDVVASAVWNGLTVDEISDLDLSYTPPFASPWDAVQLAAQAWTATDPRRARSALDA